MESGKKINSCILKRTECVILKAELLPRMILCTWTNKQLRLNQEKCPPYFSFKIKGTYGLALSCNSTNNWNLWQTSPSETSDIDCFWALSYTGCNKKTPSKLKFVCFKFFSNFWISLISIYLQFSYINIIS